MEAAWLANALIHPAAIALLILVVLASVVVLYWGSDERAKISGRQLGRGYVAVVLTALAISSVVSYVPPEEAARTWHVPTEFYWEALRTQFLVTSVPLVYASLIGLAIVGTPVMFALAKRGLANVPTILMASVIVSLIATAVLVNAAQPSGLTFARDGPIIVGIHLLLSLGFCIGAGLPWRMRRTHET